MNPNAISDDTPFNGNVGAAKNHELKSHRNVSVIDSNTRKFVKLDITYSQLDEYRATHTVCEICGKPVDELSRPSAKIKHKNLSIDHDHSTNTFRGLLCITCNRNLGWYERHKN